MGDALHKMASIQFKAASKEDCTFFYIYHQGRKDMALELLNFDKNTAEALAEAAANTTNESEGN